MGPRAESDDSRTLGELPGERRGLPWAAAVLIVLLAWSQAVRGAESPGERGFEVASRSLGTQPDTEPPAYVRRLDQTDLPALQDLSAVEFNAEHRLRFEYRDDDLRRSVAGADAPFLLRTRAYVGLKEALDPLRFGLEVQDSHRVNSHFPPNNLDDNAYDFLQAFGELHFKEALDDEHPLRLQYGRMTLDYADRRLIARNVWRNTTNSFQGFRGILGQRGSDWEVDVVAVQPVERLMTRPDRPVDRDWFYGVIGNWRRWSEVVTLQPYYLFLDSHGEANPLGREIHTVALRGYGDVGETGYDFDVDIAFQCGHDARLRHRALGVAAVLGRTFDAAWQPRLSGVLGYASGDRDPSDDVQQRFDRLFGASRPWSRNLYFTWQNLITPQARLEFQPHEKVRIDGNYSAFWLASATDEWVVAHRRDPTGQSGTFVGQELDVRLRHALTRRLDLTLGYAHFIPGEFTKKTGRGDDTDFLYVEVTGRLIK